MGRGRRGLAEMQKHPEAGTAAAGRGAFLTEHGDPKLRARGRGEGAGQGSPSHLLIRLQPEARAGFWGK